MAKKLLSVVLLIACAAIFASCDDSEYLNVGDCKLDKNLFFQTYTIDDEECCVLKWAKPIANGEVQSKVVGYGWKSIATYEVLDNGKLSRENFYDDMDGGGPTHYWFESSQQLVKYSYIDALPADAFRQVAWSYDAAMGFIIVGDSRSAMVDRYEQVLKLDETDGYTLMYTISKQGMKNDGKGGYEPFYAMTVYRRMTNEELKKIQETYTYDLNKELKSSLK